MLLVTHKITKKAARAAPVYLQETFNGKKTPRNWVKHWKGDPLINIERLTCDFFYMLSETGIVAHFAREWQDLAASGTYFEAYRKNF